MSLHCCQQETLVTRPGQNHVVAWILTVIRRSAEAARLYCKDYVVARYDVVAGTASISICVLDAFLGKARAHLMPAPRSSRVPHVQRGTLPTARTARSIRVVFDIYSLRLLSSRSVRCRSRRLRLIQRTQLKKTVLHCDYERSRFKCRAAAIPRACTATRHRLTLQFPGIEQKWVAAQQLSGSAARSARPGPMLSPPLRGATWQSPPPVLQAPPPASSGPGRPARRPQ